MRFTVVLPAADLLVEVPAAVGGGPRLGPDSDAVLATYRCSGTVHGRPAFKSIEDSVFGPMCLFFLPKMGRWIIAAVRADGTGTETMVARSIRDDGCTWVSQWPWAVQRDGWELADVQTIGLSEAGATFALDRRISVRLSSPSVTIQGSSDSRLQGVFEPCGMVNDRVFYQRVRQHSKHEHGGAMCLWFAEDRGQWVVSTPELLGDSGLVVARISSRAWWPWEAHLGGTTSPASVGATPFSAAPPWQGGAKLLGASCRCWEATAEHDLARSHGGFVEDRSLRVQAMFEPRMQLTAADTSTFHFLGSYEMAGLVSSRPFYRQVPGTLPELAQHAALIGTIPAPLFVLWFSEEHQSWVVSAEFRFLDHASAEARVRDSTWVPWDASGLWEVPDSMGGFVADPSLSATLACDA